MAERSKRAYCAVVFEVRETELVGGGGHLRARVVRWEETVGTHFDVLVLDPLPEQANVAIRLMSPHGTLVGGVPMVADAAGHYGSIKRVLRGGFRFYVPFPSLHGATGTRCTLILLFFSRLSGDEYEPSDLLGSTVLPLDVGVTDCWDLIAFLEPLVRICMSVAQAGGDRSGAKARAVRAKLRGVFTMDVPEQDALERCMRLGPPARLDETVRLITRRIVALSTPGVLETLVDIARADGDVSTIEWGSIRAVAELLDISPADWAFLAPTLGAAM